MTQDLIGIFVFQLWCGFRAEKTNSRVQALTRNYETALPVSTVWILYRYSIDTVSIQYRCSIDTVSRQYRYRIDTVSLQYRYCIDSVSIVFALIVEWRYAVDIDIDIDIDLDIVQI